MLQGKHLGLWQCFLLLAPGTEVPSTCPSCLPPRSWTLKFIFEPFNSSSQAFFNALASSPSGYGGIMSAPSLMFVPRGSLGRLVLLYQRFHVFAAGRHMRYFCRQTSKRPLETLILFFRSQIFCKRFKNLYLAGHALGKDAAEVRGSPLWIYSATISRVFVKRELSRE